MSYEVPPLLFVGTLDRKQGSFAFGLSSISSALERERERSLSGVMWILDRDLEWK